MRILMCSIEAPLPPTNGLRLQVAALMESLGRRHDVRLLGFRMPDQVGAKAPESIRVIDWPPRGLGQKVRLATEAGFRRYPFGLAELERLIAPLLREEIERFDPDLVHVTPGRLAGLGRLVKTPSVLAALDAAYVNYEARRLLLRGVKRWAMAVQIARMKRFEERAYARLGKVVVVTDEDLKALRRLNQSLRVTVIPNGVDSDRFAPVAGVARQSNLVIFTGVMNYAPNVAAARYLAREIMPRLRERVPAARLMLVGRTPDPTVRELADADGVEVVGDVDDMATWLSRASAYVCPMVSGTGIKNKLLEAMANGLPCVGSSLAVQGTEVVNGKHVLIADQTEEISNHIARLLSDDDLASRLGRAARSYVMSHHSWDAVARKYEETYEEVIAAAEVG
ncbi:MAG: glycosyltransferase family 4 protein [Actinomycetota bacterium]|nr:glycosyltransferase family 4 protein [Actinomycetota bacterium]